MAEQQWQGKAFLLTAVLWALPVLAAAVPASARGTLEEGLALLAKGRECLYNTPFDQAQGVLEQAREIFRELAASGPQEERHLARFWAGEASLELGTWYEAQGAEKKESLAQAAKEFAEAEAEARQALKLKKDFAGAYRLLADSYMRQMAYKGAFYAMSKGGEAKKLIDIALRLDGHAADNYLTAGLWYQGAPEMVGGSLSKALECFRRTEELAETDFQRFRARVWKGITLNRLKEYGAAQEAFVQALTIYPQSAWARSGLAEAETAGKGKR